MSNQIFPNPFPNQRLAPPPAYSPVETVVAPPAYQEDILPAYQQVLEMPGPLPQEYIQAYMTRQGRRGAPPSDEEIARRQRESEQRREQERQRRQARANPLLVNTQYQEQMRRQRQ